MLVEGLARVLHVCTLFSKSLSSAWDYTAHARPSLRSKEALIRLGARSACHDSHPPQMNTTDDDDARRRMPAMTALHAMRLLVCGVAGRRTTIAMEELGRL